MSSRNYHIVIMCFLTWFASAFIFVQIPAISKEIKFEVFPSTDVVTSILMVAITLSISLIARFLGGVFLGYFSNIYGFKIIVYSILGLATLTFFQILVIENNKFVNEVIAFPYVFIVLRFLIGFCIGGIWPNLGIFTLEEFYRNSNGSKDNEKFRKEVQRYGMKSAFIQTGLTFSFLIESIIIIIIAIHYDIIEDYLGILFLNSNLLQLQFTSIFGLIILYLVSLYWLYYIRKSRSIHNEYYSNFLFLNSKSNSLRDLLANRKYRFTLFNLWLIMTGLMYMYYSTVIVTPELLYRFNFQDLIQNLPISIQEEWITISVAISSVMGHLMLGVIYLKKSDNNKDYDENRDFIWIKNISKVIILFVTIAFATYSIIIFIDNSKNHSGITFFMIIVQIILAFLANLPWGLIPSIITSRFPKHFRFLAGSLAYNGGLAISFVSPFFIQQVILYNFGYFFVLFPMFLGGLSVWWGSRRILNDFLPNLIKGEKKYGYFQIRIPAHWGIPLSSTTNVEFADRLEIIEEKQFYKDKSNSRWIMSIYYLENKNNEKFLDYDIIPLLRQLIKIKVDKHMPVLLKELASIKKIEDIISENEEENPYFNFKIEKKKSFFIRYKIVLTSLIIPYSNNVLTSLIIPYSNNIYIIIYHNNQNNNKDDNNIISKVIDTFDIKIPLKEI